VAPHLLKRSLVPSGAGTYALVIALDRSQNITIGRRGGFHFPAGFYIYVGSALGPGGLSARLARHLRAEKRLHWHIDFLLRSVRARVVEAWTMESAARLECEWARAMMQWPGARIVVPRFGASDCRCGSHLIGFDKLPEPGKGPIAFERVRIE
jgi:Uri superfamily endonuclease